MFFQGVAQPCLGRPVGKPGLELFPPEPGVQSDTGGSLQILGELWHLTPTPETPAFVLRLHSNQSHTYDHSSEIQFSVSKMRMPLAGVLGLIPQKRLQGCQANKDKQPRQI